MIFWEGQKFWRSSRQISSNLCGLLRKPQIYDKRRNLVMVNWCQNISFHITVVQKPNENLHKLLKKGDKKTFSPSKNMFSCPPLFKALKKVVKFSPTKNILVFGFSFWFQFIQWIEQKFWKLNGQPEIIILENI